MKQLPLTKAEKAKTRTRSGAKSAINEAATEEPSSPKGSVASDLFSDKSAEQEDGDDGD